MSKLLIGRFVFIAASSVIVVMAGGGVAFIHRSVGMIYLALWVVWWLVTHWGGNEACPRRMTRSKAQSSWPLVS